MVALDGQLFYSTQIPVCQWFPEKKKNKNTAANRGSRDHRKLTLLTDLRKLVTLIDRVHRELTDVDLKKITSRYHAWRRARRAPQIVNYANVPGFYKFAVISAFAVHGHVLTLGRYVGNEEVEDDGNPFEEKMPRLVAELHAQFAESAKLEKHIKGSLGWLRKVTLENGLLARACVARLGALGAYRRPWGLSAPLGLIGALGAYRRPWGLSETRRRHEAQQLVILGERRCGRDRTRAAMRASGVFRSRA